MELYDLDYIEHVVSSAETRNFLKPRSEVLEFFHDFTAIQSEHNPVWHIANQLGGLATRIDLLQGHISPDQLREEL